MCRGLYLVFNQSYRALLDAGLIAETEQPMDVRLSAEPRHLPFRVISVRLLYPGDGALLPQISGEQLHGLLVSD